MDIEEMIGRLEQSSVLTVEVLAEMRSHRASGYSTDPKTLTASEISKLTTLDATISPVLTAVGPMEAATESPKAGRTKVS